PRRKLDRRSSVWRLDNAGSHNALAVQLLDLAPREIGNKGIFVASYKRFELGDIIGTFDPVPSLEFFSDILRRWSDLCDSNQCVHRANFGEALIATWFCMCMRCKQGQQKNDNRMIQWAPQVICCAARHSARRQTSGFAGRVDLLPGVMAVLI